MNVIASSTRVRRRLQPRPAFSLIETMVAMVIVTIAITALCGMLAAGTNANVSGNELTTAVNMAAAVHEIAVGLPLSNSGQPVIGPWHDVWDLNGLKFSPPIDAARRPIPSCPNWEQRVTVQSVDSNNISQAIDNDRNGPAARLTVEIYHEGHLVYTTSWLVLAGNPV
jgi:prepilin-type N-terminal cleavage/methylation domain-containing protein